MMIKKSKLINKLSLLIALTLFTLSGCKKNRKTSELSDQELIQKAQSWYEAQQKNVINSVGIAVGKESKLTLTPNWEDADVLRINGIVSISTELETNLKAITKVNKYFELVIKIDGSDFDSRILNVNSNDATADGDALNGMQLYQTAFTNTDLSKDGVNAEIKVYTKRFQQQVDILYTATGKTLIPEGRPKIDKKVDADACFDAYMYIREYDFYGNLIDEYQEYLGFEICHFVPDGIDPDNPFGSGSGGGSGGDTGAIVNIEWGEADDTSIGYSNNTASGGEVTSTNVSWYCYKAHGGAIKFKSYDVINYTSTLTGMVHFYTRNYFFSSMTHASLLSEGEIQGQDITPLFATYMDMTTPSSAGIQLTFKDRRQYTQNGTAHYKYSGDKNAIKHWTFENLGLSAHMEVN